MLFPQYLISENGISKVCYKYQSKLSYDYLSSSPLTCPQKSNLFAIFTNDVENRGCHNPKAMETKRESDDTKMLVVLETTLDSFG